MISRAIEKHHRLTHSRLRGTRCTRRGDTRGHPVRRSWAEIPGKYKRSPGGHHLCAVVGAHRGIQGCFKRATRVRRVLTQLNAQTALREKQVGRAARPVSRRHSAHRDRVRQSRSRRTSGRVTCCARAPTLRARHAPPCKHRTHGHLRGGSSHGPHDPVLRSRSSGHRRSW